MNYEKFWLPRTKRNGGIPCVNVSSQDIYKEAGTTFFLGIVTTVIKLFRCLLLVNFLKVALLTEDDAIVNTLNLQDDQLPLVLKIYGKSNHNTLPPSSYNHQTSMEPFFCLLDCLLNGDDGSLFNNSFSSSLSFLSATLTVIYYAKMVLPIDMMLYDLPSYQCDWFQYFNLINKLTLIIFPQTSNDKFFVMRCAKSINDGLADVIPVRTSN
ncbi:hypothetical protein AGLY_000538 [Aphis glycines]|uniref:Uncharacterized protein n=1 Tax=Aphis glycines TaxID=307491 RepID=A0A6G0U792_APHGL|nr:hypothetical protein AGLY_000538 [Aphis glycines]